MRKGNIVRIIVRCILVASLIFAFAPLAFGSTPELVTFVTFDLGSNVYAETSALGEAINKATGTKVRIIPVGNSVARAITLKTGTAQFWNSCSAYYTTAEGIGEFAEVEWGPQPLRIVYLANREVNFSPATAKNSPIKTIADIKGKKVSWIVGNPAINMQLEGYLAYAGLTTNDVELVKFPGYSASLKGLITKQVDVVMSSSISTGSYEIESSPVGLAWIPIPHENKEGWKRVQEKAPFVGPIIVKTGAGVKEPIEVGSYPCPAVVTLKNQDSDLVFWMTKMVVENWPIYKDVMSTGAYWEPEKALKSHFSVPYHEGAIKYFTEKGLWTDEHETRQKYLVKRQDALLKAFTKAQDDFQKLDKKSTEFPAYWSQSREELLASLLED